MKLSIVFLCGSLEPRRDGVGDYVRRLANELIRTGHNISAIALNDKYIFHESTDNQYTDSIELPAFRIPANWTAKRRFKRLEEWLKYLKPDWLSLQYVSFSFQSHGFPLELGYFLKNLGKNYKWHIMFHELWIGMDKEAPLKYTWWGLAQRQHIKLLIKQLNPRVIHTQSQLYQAQLQNLKLSVDYLPLPSNIPVNSRSSNDTPSEFLQTSDLSFVLFGSVHHGSSVKSFVYELSTYVTAKNLTVSLIVIGHTSEEQRYWARVWGDKGFMVHILGEQSSETISNILSVASFGITTTPLFLTEKSGTVSAMLEHGLPVICVSRPWHPRVNFHFDVLPGIVEYVSGNIASCISPDNIIAHPDISITSVANKFLARLLSSL